MAAVLPNGTPTVRKGKLARKTGHSQETIRYYERNGLLVAPTRSASNYRDYRSGYVNRLRFIGNCRSLDRTLDAVRQLLALRDNPEARCGDVNALLDDHPEPVRLRMWELTPLTSPLQWIRAPCGRDRATRDWGILDELGRMAPANTSDKGGQGNRRGSPVPGRHGPHRGGSLE
ncbi:MerR family transcriptional regulator [Marinobacter caseinilyticus]|uniref:MerR family transcriptional regulator n=1 Tax=Marinobacter caseinilyticus TaxID=2692195 RepID=UPI00140CBCD8|nr:MerR family transcriptional regulator [Marinobacter caseinilyticus]